METSYQKLIHDYLEGTLSEDDQRKLFDNLSSNPEWREELSFQMRMHEAMQKDLGAVTIPTKATAEVFSALGFGVPQEMTETVFTKVLPRVGGFKSLMGMLSLSFAASLLLLFSPDHSESVKSLPEPQQGMQKSSIIKNSSAPVVTSPAIIPAVQKDVHHNTGVADVHKASLDIGKLSSVDYLTKSKIVGISSGGNIYLSDDGGSLWANLHSNTSKDLYGLHFTDSLNGAVVGAGGTILLTADAGKNWASVSSGTDVNLIAVKYVTHDILYACGAQGTILCSTSGGLVWKKLESGVSSSLFSIHFENAKKGSIGGEHGIVLETTDGGNTWLQKK